jgi:hypothetical protein
MVRSVSLLTQNGQKTVWCLVERRPGREHRLAVRIALYFLELSRLSVLMDNEPNIERANTVLGGLA